MPAPNTNIPKDISLSIMSDNQLDNELRNGNVGKVSVIAVGGAGLIYDPRCTPGYKRIPDLENILDVGNISDAKTVAQFDKQTAQEVMQFAADNAGKAPIIVVAHSRDMANAAAITAGVADAAGIERPELPCKPNTHMLNVMRDAAGIEPMPDFQTREAWFKRTNKYGHTNVTSGTVHAVSDGTAYISATEHVERIVTKRGQKMDMGRDVTKYYAVPEDEAFATKEDALFRGWSKGEQCRFMRDGKIVDGTVMSYTDNPDYHKASIVVDDGLNQQEIPTMLASRDIRMDYAGRGQARIKNTEYADAAIQESAKELQAYQKPAAKTRSTADLDAAVANLSQSEHTNNVDFNY